MNNVFNKKVFSVGIIIILSIMLSVAVMAVTPNEKSYLTDANNEITINIKEAEYLSDAQIKKIISIVTAYHYRHETFDNSTQYGLMCTLFGHDTQENSVSMIEHKVRATNPRCLETQYIVTTCSRCDYENIEPLLKVYISCCD